jgi:hypothetical protein
MRLPSSLGYSHLKNLTAAISKTPGQAAITASEPMAGNAPCMVGAQHRMDRGTGR